MSVICENCKRSFRTWGLRKSCPYCWHVIGDEPYDYKPPQSLFCPDCGMILSGGGHRHICPSRPEDALFSLSAATVLNPSHPATGEGFMGPTSATTPVTPIPETPSTTDYSPSGGDSSSSGSDSSSSGGDSSGS